jgi:hypothetical protein
MRGDVLFRHMSERFMAPIIPEKTPPPPADAELRTTARYPKPETLQYPIADKTDGQKEARIPLVKTEGTEFPMTLQGKPDTIPGMAETLPSVEALVETARGLGMLGEESVPATVRDTVRSAMDAPATETKTITVRGLGELGPAASALNQEAPVAAPDKVGEAEAERQATLQQMEAYAQRLDEVSIPYLGDSTEPKVIKQKQDKKRLTDEVKSFMATTAKDLIGQLGKDEGEKIFMAMSKAAGFNDEDLVRGAFMDAVMDIGMNKPESQAG